MLHNVVVNLKNSNVLYGYYRTDDASGDPSCRAHTICPSA